VATLALVRVVASLELTFTINNSSQRRTDIVTMSVESSDREIEHARTHRVDFVRPGENRLWSITDTPVGEMFLVSDGTSLVELQLPSFGPWNTIADNYICDDGALRTVADEISAYFEGDLLEFTFAIAPSGTPFQLSVWQALCDIDYGSTATYGEIAASVGRPKASRAVGMANHVNPIALIVPCHRVIGANGSLTGYGGGLELKTSLLALESLVAAGELPHWDAGSIQPQ
jgi:methylated-DNA-[protein]-cysteine S-methyltransferase